MIKRILLAVALVGLVACGDEDCDHKVPPAPAPAPQPTPPIPDLPDLPFPIPDLPTPGEPDPGQSPAPTPAPGDQLGELEILINQERASHGLAILSSEQALSCAAAAHAADIGPRRACSHTGGDGSSFSLRVQRCGGWLQTGGEIIACGQGTPKEAVQAWLASPGHKAVMLDSRQRSMGAGMTGNFWVVVFSG